MTTKQFFNNKTDGEILLAVRVSQEKMMESIPGSTSEFIHKQMYEAAKSECAARGLEL